MSQVTLEAKRPPSPAIGGRKLGVMGWSYAFSIVAVMCYPAEIAIRALGQTAGRSFASDWVLRPMSLWVIPSRLQ